MPDTDTNNKNDANADVDKELTWIQLTEAMHLCGHKCKYVYRGRGRYRYKSNTYINTIKTRIHIQITSMRDTNEEPIPIRMHIPS
jgi:hypothetical protein